MTKNLVVDIKFDAGKVIELERWTMMAEYCTERTNYYVSDLGRVKSVKQFKGKKEIVTYLKPKVQMDGYLSVNPKPNGRSTSLKVHALVMKYFVGDRPIINGLTAVIDHLDGDITNNRLTNLEYVSVRENTNRGYDKQETSSKYRGVNWHKSSKTWQTRVSHNGKRKTLGHFKNEQEAGQAYIDYCKEHNLN